MRSLTTPYIYTYVMWLSYTHIQTFHHLKEHKHTCVSKYKNQWPQSLVIPGYKYSTTLENTSIHAHPNMKINDIITWLYKHPNIPLLRRIQVYKHIQTWHCLNHHRQSSRIEIYIYIYTSSLKYHIYHYQNFLINLFHACHHIRRQLRLLYFRYADNFNSLYFIL